jgi:hypothetical protein
LTEKETRHGGEGVAPPIESIALDTLEGIEAIAGYIGKSQRRVYYLCETRQIPVFKLGGKWHLRKSTYAAHIARLEADAAGTAAQKR